VLPAKMNSPPAMVSRLEGSVNVVGEAGKGGSRMAIETSVYIVVQPSMESMSLCVDREIIPAVAPQSELWAKGN